MIKTCKKPPLSFPAYSGDICSFSSYHVGLPLKSHTVEVKAVQAEGTPTPATPIPISGWSEVNIGNVSDYGKYFRGLYQGIYIFLNLGALSWELQNTNDTCNRWRASSNILTASRSYNNINNFTDNGWFQGVSVTSTTTTTNMIDTRTNVIYLNIKKTVFDGNVTEFNSWVQGKYLIYELATPTTPTITDAQFEMLCTAFNIEGQHVLVQFGQTVYGAIINLITGVMTITHKIADMGDLTWRYSSSNIDFYTEDINDISTEADFDDMLCSCFKVVSSSTSYSDMPDLSVKRGTNSTQIRVKDLSLTDSTAFTTAVTGQKLVYKLATPTTIQLSTAQILTLSKNNVFASTGRTSLEAIKIGG